MSFVILYPETRDISKEIINSKAIINSRAIIDSKRRNNWQINAPREGHRI